MLTHFLCELAPLAQGGYLRLLQGGVNVRITQIQLEQVCRASTR
jgi:aspartyl-tRNA(Asn)/glutamyl-tRNA(Gln) amidotransferase subunit B